METTYIYAVCEAGTPFYVGQSTNLASRYRSHKFRWKPRQIELRTLEQTTQESADERERFWIEELRKEFHLLNKESGGKRGYFVKRPDTSRLNRIRMARMSAEEKTSLAKKARAAVTPEGQAVIRETLIKARINRWANMTPEGKAAISARVREQMKRVWAERKASGWNPPKSSPRKKILDAR